MTGFGDKARRSFKKEKKIRNIEKILISEKNKKEREKLEKKLKFLKTPNPRTLPPSTNRLYQNIGQLFNKIRILKENKTEYKKDSTIRDFLELFENMEYTINPKRDKKFNIKNDNIDFLVNKFNFDSLSELEKFFEMYVEKFELLKIAAGGRRKKSRKISKKKSRKISKKKSRYRKR